MEEPAMVEHFELAQGARGTPPEAKFCRGRVVKLSRVQSSIDQSKFIRLSSDSFPDLEGEQIKSLYDHCLDAHRSADFYLNAATNQWVRTSIACDSDPQKLFCSLVGSSNLTIQSNVLPCDPFLTKLDQASKRIHFPCSLLMDAYHQKKSLMEKLLEWRETQDCELSKLIHGSENSVGRSLRLFWEIQDGVEDIKQLAKGSDGTVWLVIWKGGRFVRKERRRDDSGNDADPRDVLDTELNVTEKLSHPHIVYSFGVSFATNKSSLFMEYMQNDLRALIIELVRKNDSNRPPFSLQDSLDILLQTAKAMVYMHEQNVVHGDLKCLNILVSEFFISSDATKYLVKVADFGSARSMIESKDFEPGAGTTEYAAPEALMRRSDKSVVISHPKLIDVYSFGIIAFEVLTGLKPYSDYRSGPNRMKEGIIGGTLRPPLREECQEVNFLYDHSLLSLIERCWDKDLLIRPSFLEVVEELNNVKVRLLNSQLQDNHRKRKCVDDTTLSREEPSSCLHRRQSSSLPSRHLVGLERIGMASLKHLFDKVLAGIGLASMEPSDINAQSARPEISFELQSRDLPSTRLLGKGLAGIGYETTWKGARYARKDFFGVQKDIFLKEASRLVGLRDHKNIVKTYGWTTDKRSCSLVLEYMEDDLVSLLHKTRNSNKVLSKQSSTSPFDLPEALHMMVQIAAGVAYLHGEKLVHGDLKTKNILVSRKKGGELSSTVVKVTDYGLVQTKRKSEFIVSRQVRKLDMVRWKAPECWRKQFMRKLSSEDETSSESDSESSSSSASRVSFTPPVVNVVDEFAADVYSFAMICTHLLTGDILYPHMKWKELGHKILSGSRPVLPDTICPELRGLLVSCWGESALRPSCAVVCNELTLIKQSLTTVIARVGQGISFELQSRDLPSTRLLGKGLAGIGYETTWNGGRYARKDFFGVQKDTFLEEAPRLVGLRDHKNIVKTYGCTTDKRSCSLVLEYMDDDLVSLLQKTRNSNKDLSKQSSTLPFDLPEALDMMVQIAAGVAYLHEEKLVHGDLKTKNILVSRVKGGALNSKVVKVTDYGLVQTKRKSEFIVSRQVRKLDMVRWKAPECWRMQFMRKLNSEDETSSESESESASGVSFTPPVVNVVDEFAADVYSFAMICSELLTGDTPYPHMKWKESGHKILGGLRPNLPITCHPMLKDLLMSCWGDNPAKRPSFAIICLELTSIQQSIATGQAQSRMWKGRAEKEDVVVEDCAASSKMVTPMQSHSSGAEAASRSPFYSARSEGLIELRTKFDNQLESDVESSRSYWTEVSAATATFEDSDVEDSDVEVPNSVVFEEMKEHPEWGPVFRRPPYELEIGAKIGEGGQAEIFEAVGWNKYDPKCAENNKKTNLVVKVFKHGYSLRELRRLWPPGIASAIISHLKGIGIYDDHLCLAVGVHLMNDGRFAFVYHRYWGDLRKLIDENMMKWNGCPPFSGLTTFRFILSIAQGMCNLHKLGILHNDLKAANVMVLDPGRGVSAVADFESSLGVIGTGFWRAPEVLLAFKNRNFEQETFTQQVDVYSFAMTCYEVITGCVPFEGHMHGYDIVLCGGRPTLPDDLPYSMFNELVTKCWHQHPKERPSFVEILKELEALGSSDWSKFDSKFLATRNEKKNFGGQRL